MRVLIAGGAGFIGSHLSEHFITDGHAVIAVDNLVTGSEKNIRHLVDHPQFAFIEHDICEPIDVDGDIDVILNFASPASPPQYLNMPIKTLKTGSFGTYHCLELATRKNAKFLMASTSEIYGDPEVHPQNESYLGNVSSIGPRSVYDEAKRFSEAMTMAYHRAHNVDTRIVRIFNTYGPRMNLKDGRVVPNFIVQALKGLPLTIYGDGEQTRSFQYVDDLVRGVRCLLDSDHNEPVNIGNPREMTILEFAEIVNEITQNPGGIILRKDSRVKGDPQRRQPDISKAEEILKWKPQVDLHEGLEKTIKYFRELV